VLGRAKQCVRTLKVDKFNDLPVTKRSNADTVEAP
jgi:hypothetical protein